MHYEEQPRFGVSELQRITDGLKNLGVQTFNLDIRRIANNSRAGCPLHPNGICTIDLVDGSYYHRCAKCTSTGSGQCCTRSCFNFPFDIVTGPGKSSVLIRLRNKLCKSPPVYKTHAPATPPATTTPTTTTTTTTTPPVEEEEEEEEVVSKKRVRSSNKRVRYEEEEATPAPLTPEEHTKLMGITFDKWSYLDISRWLITESERFGTQFNVLRLVLTVVRYELSGQWFRRIWGMISCFETVGERMRQLRMILGKKNKLKGLQLICLYQMMDEFFC
jgi:hypothetical protein